MPYLFHLLFLAAFAVVMFGCGDKKPNGPVGGESCSPYYLSDFNSIVLGEKSKPKAGYSGDLFQQCEKFKLKYGFSSQCRGFSVESGAAEIARSNAIKAICTRNERQRPSSSQPQPINVVQDPEAINWKMIIMDHTLFNAAIESTRNFSNRDVFTNGTTRSIASVAKEPKPDSFCIYSSNGKLRDHEVLDGKQMKEYKSADDPSKMISIYHFRTASNLDISFYCLRPVAKSESALQVLRRNLGRTAVIN